MTGLVGPHRASRGRHRDPPGWMAEVAAPLSGGSASRSSSGASLAISRSSTRTSPMASPKAASRMTTRITSVMASEPFRLEHGDAEVNEHGDRDCEQDPLHYSHLT